MPGAIANRLPGKDVDRIAATLMAPNAEDITILPHMFYGFAKRCAEGYGRTWKPRSHVRWRGSQAALTTSQRRSERTHAIPDHTKTSTSGTHTGNSRRGSAQSGHHQKADARNVRMSRNQVLGIWPLSPAPTQRAGHSSTTTPRSLSCWMAASTFRRILGRSLAGAPGASATAITRP